MPNYKIECEYISRVTLIVEVPEGKNPMNDDNWGEFLQETETNYTLSDVLSAQREVQP
jgi:hypothetical protein